MYILFPFLTGCAHVPAPAGLASPAASTGSLAAFTAHYEGAQLGLGLDCVIVDAPPHGAWTAGLMVTDPGTSGLTAGEFVCVVIHSPSHFRGDFVNAAGLLACRVVTDVKPTRFSCDPDHPPTADMPVFDQASWDRLAAEQGAVSAGEGPPPLSDRTLAESSALLDAHLARLSACNPGDVAVILATLIQTVAHTVLERGDTAAFLETRSGVEMADAQVLAALEMCK